MEATRPVQLTRPTTRSAEAPRLVEMSKESTQDCTGCGATIAPVDQFYGEEGVRCPACHLEADEVSVHHDPVPWAVGKALVLASYPAFLTSTAYGALATWLYGGLLDRHSGPTMLVLVLLLGALGGAALRVGTSDLRDAYTGRIAVIQTRAERVLQGLSGAWMTAHGTATLAMMATLAWLVIEL